MNEGRPRQDDTAREALGDVARDVIDHVSMLVRDEVKIARLSARRYAEHLRADVAPRAGLIVGAAVLALLAVVFALIALFRGLVAALGSVTWTLVIFAALFALGAAVMVGFARQAPPEARRAIVPYRGDEPALPQR